MLKPQRNTKKAARAREMIAAIFHIPLREVRNDRCGVLEMYTQLEKLNFEWVADEQEWLNTRALDPKHTTVMSFVVGSPTHSVEVAATVLIEALEKQGYTVASTELVLDLSGGNDHLVKIEVLK